MGDVCIADYAYLIAMSEKKSDLVRNPPKECDFPCLKSLSFIVFIEVSSFDAIKKSKARRTNPRLKSLNLEAFCLP